MPLFTIAIYVCILCRKDAITNKFCIATLYNITYHCIFENFDTYWIGC